MIFGVLELYFDTAYTWYRSFIMVPTSENHHKYL